MTLKIRRAIGLLCLSLSASTCLWAQAVEEKKILLQQLAIEPKQTIYTAAANNKNELQVVFSGLFLAYKQFISSQDLPRCTFHPSCSEYGIIAVKQLGLTRGMLSTFDRLTRCNGLSPGKIPN